MAAAAPNFSIRMPARGEPIGPPMPPTPPTPRMRAAVLSGMPWACMSAGAKKNTAATVPNTDRNASQSSIVSTPTPPMNSAP